MKSLELKAQGAEWRVLACGGKPPFLPPSHFVVYLVCWPSQEARIRTGEATGHEVRASLPASRSTKPALACAQVRPRWPGQRRSWEHWGASGEPLGSREMRCVAPGDAGGGPGSPTGPRGERPCPLVSATVAPASPDSPDAPDVSEDGEDATASLDSEPVPEDDGAPASRPQGYLKNPKPENLQAALERKSGSNRFQPVSTGFARDAS